MCMAGLMRMGKTWTATFPIWTSGHASFPAAHAVTTSPKNWPSAKCSADLLEVKTQIWTLRYIIKRLVKYYNAYFSRFCNLTPFHTQKCIKWILDYSDNRPIKFRVFPSIIFMGKLSIIFWGFNLLLFLLHPSIAETWCRMSILIREKTQILKKITLTRRRPIKPNLANFRVWKVIAQDWCDVEPIRIAQS